MQFQIDTYNGNYKINSRPHPCYNNYGTTTIVRPFNTTTTTNNNNNNHHAASWEVPW